MRRRTEGAAEAAAQAASEAARVLQQRSQEVRSRPEAPPEPPPPPKAEPRTEPAPKAKDKQDDDQPSLSTDRIQELRKGNPRNKMLDELEQRDLERRGVQETPAETQPDQKAESPPAEPPAEPAAAAPQPEAPVAETTPPVPTVKVKVDGEEFDVPQTEIDEAGGLSAYRQTRAAENRLKKANELVAETRRSQAAILEWIQRQTPPEQQQPKVSDAEFIKSKLDAIRFGTEEDAAAAFKEALERMVPKAPDANAITQQAIDAINHQSAVREFDQKNADLVTNPVVLQAIVALRHNKLQQHRQAQPNVPIDWQKFYATIAHEVRSAFGRPSQSAAPTPPTSGNPSQPTSEKEARKASIVTLPASAARAAPPKEEKEPSRAEIIAEMKKSRGQLG